MSNVLRNFLDSVDNEEVPFVLITHKNCMDGTGAALAVIKYCDDRGLQRPIIMPMQYGDKLDMTLLADHNILMTDFSFDRDVLVELEYVSHNLFIIDHHSSAKKELDGLDYCYFDMDHSGASLTWLLLHNEVPELIAYIEDRDLWNWKLAKSREVSAALNLIGTEEYDNLLTCVSQQATCVSQLMQKGQAIIEYQESKIDSVKKKLVNNDIRMVVFEGYTVPMFNNSHLISEVGNMMSKEHPFSIQYFITMDEIVFSFRSNDEVDLTTLTIPKGHPNAAGRGFKLKDVDLNIILGGKDIDVGKYLIEQLRVSEKKEVTGPFKFSSNSSDLVTVGLYSIVDNGGTFFSEHVIDQIVKKDIMLCELCQPQASATSDFNDFNDLIKRVNCIDETNVCASMSNIKVEVDKVANTVKIMAAVKPYGPKADVLMNNFDSGNFSMAYRGFAKGNELVNIVTFDIVSKLCANKRIVDSIKNIERDITDLDVGDKRV